MAFLLTTQGDFVLQANGSSKIILAVTPTEFSDSFTVSDTIAGEKVIQTPGLIESFRVSDSWKDTYGRTTDSFAVDDQIEASGVKTPGTIISEGFTVSDGWDAYKGQLTAKQIIHSLMNRDGTTSRKVSRSELDRVVNKINLQYDRDWGDSGKEPYKKTILASDAGSISRYGEKERPDLFRLDFVRSDSMAANLRDFYLARLNERRKKVRLTAFLDLVEVEFGDPAAVVAPNYLICETQKVNIRPGSGMKKRIDMIEFEFLEY